MWICCTIVSIQNLDAIPAFQTTNNVLIERSANLNLADIPGDVADPELLCSEMQSWLLGLKWTHSRSLSFSQKQNSRCVQSIAVPKQSRTNRIRSVTETFMYIKNTGSQTMCMLYKTYVPFPVMEGRREANEWGTEIKKGKTVLKHTKWRRDSWRYQWEEWMLLKSCIHLTAFQRGRLKYRKIERGDKLNNHHPSSYFVRTLEPF